MGNGLKSILMEQSYFGTPIFSQDIYEETFVNVWKLEKYPFKTKVYEKTLRQNEDKLADLTPYEQYIFELMKVPRLKQRIECLLFNYRFDIEFIELNKTLENINEALQAI